MKMLIVGSGMYVRGDMDIYAGTIGPAAIEAARLGLIDSVDIYSLSTNGEKKCVDWLKKLAKLSGISDDIFYSVKNDKNFNGSLDEYLKTRNFDLSIIATPDHTHYETIKTIVFNNINCLVVKPMVESYSEAQELSKEIKKRGLIGCVDFHKRYDSANMLIKDSLSMNKLGKLIRVNVDYGQKKIIPEDKFSSWVNESNVFQYLGVHYVDLIYWLTQAQPKKLWVFPHEGYLQNRGVNSFDTISVVIKWSKKNEFFESFHHTSWIEPNSSPAMSLQKIQLVGEHGRIDSDQTNRGIRITSDSDGYITPNPYFSNQYNLSKTEDVKSIGYGIESIITFINKIYGIKQQPLPFFNDFNKLCSFDDASVSTLVVEAVNRCISNGTFQSDLIGINDV